MSTAYIDVFTPLKSIKAYNYDLCMHTSKKFTKKSLFKKGTP